MATLSNAFPEETVRNHPLVRKANKQARNIEAKLGRLQHRAGPTKSERSGVKLAGGDTEQGPAHKTDKAAPARTATRGALARAAKVRERVSVFPPRRCITVVVCYADVESNPAISGSTTTAKKTGGWDPDNRGMRRHSESL